MENAEKTQLFVKQVMDNLRYRYCREGQIVKITEELDAVINLLEMFKIRFGDALNYDIDIDPMCKDIYIPHYTVMTFVDNSIYNTFEDREGDFFIQISVKRVREYTELAVSDSGAGSKTMNDISCEDSKHEYGSIPSTKSRLVKQYGIEHGLKLENSKYGGMTAKILIPVNNV